VDRGEHDEDRRRSDGDDREEPEGHLGAHEPTVRPGPAQG
jgi:hypothetical protein